MGVVAVVAPLVFAAVMVVVLRNPVFALFAVLSPVLAVGGHVESTRRATKGRRRDAVRWATELTRLRSALSGAASAEVVRRRAVHPDLAEVVRRAQQPSTRLWERRPRHDDWLVLRAGTGPVPWEVPLAGPQHHTRHPDVAAAAAEVAVLPRCPVTVELAGGGVVGVIGRPRAARAVARSLLVQAAVHHGPADLPILVACDGDALAEWDWSKWLPHVVDSTGAGRRLAVGRQQSDQLADAVLESARDRSHRGRAGDERPSDAPTLLVVVDGDGLLDGRRAPLRSLLGGSAGQVAGIVLAATADRLPAMCTAIIDLDGDHGDAEVRLPALGRRLTQVRTSGLAESTARLAARALARFDDPELDGGAAGLPDAVRLLPLLGLDEPDAGAIRRRWAAAGPDPRPVAPLGVGAGGVLEVDLVTDGPHALVAGTTGAGKSELLRTLVAGLAASAGPKHLTFVLIDFKGGSAFDACARLPHTVGVVTDLDDDLAERALRCLEAELRHRERLLRAVGATDLAAYRRAATGVDDEPLPRLLVVVDEFATLKAELPDFVDALVGIAQRGRSLGVHLVLATQRPAGAVSDHVRANTNLRIALRVQDAGDSTDVVDVPDATALPRHRPGRACVRLGPREVTMVQTALVTARGSGALPPVEVRPFEFGPGMEARAPASDERTASDLDRLVAACCAAWAATGRPAPRRPWPDPLPATLDEADLAAAMAASPVDGALVAIGVADDPDRQRCVVAGWRPAEGNLAVFGVGGSGTTTSLLAVSVALATSRPPGSLHLYAVDHGAGELAVLARLPHCGAVIGAGEPERQRRLVRHLSDELARRRSTPASARTLLPEVVVLIDGAPGFFGGLDDVDGFEVLEVFERVFADGPEVGIRCVITADRGTGLRSTLAATVRQRWVHRLADPLEAGLVGLPATPPDLPPGRYVDAVTGLVAHVAVPAPGWPAAVAAVIDRWVDAPDGPRPNRVEPLPTAVEWSELGMRPKLGPRRPWSIPIGVGDDDLGPAVLRVWEGDHLLVTGPARSGRTTALATIAEAVLGADAGVAIVVLASRRSWLDRIPRTTVASSVDDAAAAVGRAGGRPVIVLVDDADAVDDAGGVLAGLVAAGHPDVHIVAAARVEALRGLYDHWTRALRRSRLGVLLRPNLDLDGDLLGATLPRRVAVPLVPGRGFVVVDGLPTLTQLAHPSATCGAPGCDDDDGDRRF